MKTLILMICALFSSLALSQTALDPTQSGAFPAFNAYSDYSCGGVRLTVLDERTNDDGTVDALVKALTVCPAGGRGGGNRYRLACTVTTFAADRYAVLNRERVLTATWLQRGGTPIACPAL